MVAPWKLWPANFVDVQSFGLVSHVACVSSPHTSNAIINWDLMKLPITRCTPLTGDVRTVAVPNVMQTASFQMMDWYVMLDQDNLVVAIMPWEVRAVPLVAPLCRAAPSSLNLQRRTICSLTRTSATRI